MGKDRRFLLVVPGIVLCAVDVALTLLGQAPDYWAGKYADVNEANPLVRPIVACGPGAFVAFAVLHSAVLSAIILRWRHRLAEGIAVLMAMSHAAGATCWIVRLGPWGWVAGGGFLMAAAEGFWWCWRQHRAAHSARYRTGRPEDGG
jgi:hypothetical protein